jgi:hypothetical protein
MCIHTSDWFKSCPSSFIPCGNDFLYANCGRHFCIGRKTHLEEFTKDKLAK